MPKTSDMRWLERHVFFNRVITLLLTAFGLVAFALYFRPELVGLKAQDAAQFKGETIWFLVGVFFLFVGLTFYFLIGRWSRRLKWIATRQPGRPMKLEIEVESDSDSTTHYARLGPAGSDRKDDFEWRAHLWIMPSKVADDVGKPFEAQVYFDPDTARPAAIEYPNGMLWIIAGSGAVKKLSH